jgi:cytochrome c-type biogenesis protein CcmF
VLAKHDERYMPREVSKALKEQGEWRGDGAPPPAYETKESPSMITNSAPTPSSWPWSCRCCRAICRRSAARGARRAGRRRARRGGGAFLARRLTFLALVHAFVVSDFSVANVAANSHTAKPLLYKVAGAWGSHEGSMLLWCLVLTGYGAAVASFGEALPPRLRAYAVATQGALGVLFLAYTVFASNPMARLIDRRSRALAESAAAGPGARGPPAVPLLRLCRLLGGVLVLDGRPDRGRVDAAWARWVRPWTLAAWSFLTVGITLGAFWAYYELGWGGWWFWDPVENASFMPWLIGTALLHSAVVLEKRGALPGWTVFLGLAAFTFSMLGAFLVRSGVLTSVHAFAVDPTRGVLLLIIMGMAAGRASCCSPCARPA